MNDGPKSFLFCYMEDWLTKEVMHTWETTLESRVGWCLHIIYVTGCFSDFVVTNILSDKESIGSDAEANLR